MIELKIRIDEKKRTFKAREISARAMRDCIKFYEKAEKEDVSELEMVDEMISIVASIFKEPEVTFDSILDGLSANELMPTLEGVFEQINNVGADEKKKQVKK